MTSLNLLIVLIVSTVVGALMGLALGGLVDNLYLALIAGILATTIAGIVRDTLITHIGPEPELEGMPQLKKSQLMIIYSAVAIDRKLPLQVTAYAVIASLAGSMSAVQIAAQSELTS